MTTEQNKSPPHTPGPWWIDNDGFIAAGNGDTYVTIADFDCSNDIDIDEREANKSLALAAHDMLGALEAGNSQDWVANAGITNDIEALRKICLAHADWWNNTAYPIIAKARRQA